MSEPTAGLDGRPKGISSAHVATVERMGGRIHWPSPPPDKDGSQHLAGKRAAKLRRKADRRNKQKPATKSRVKPGWKGSCRVATRGGDKKVKSTTDRSRKARRK